MLEAKIVLDHYDVLFARAARHQHAEIGGVGRFALSARDMPDFGAYEGGN